MRVKISLARPPSAVQLGSIAPAPHPSNGSAHNVARCRCSLRLTLLAGALVATAWVQRARPPRSCPLPVPLCSTSKRTPTHAHPI